MTIGSQLPSMIVAARTGALQALALQAGQVLTAQVIGPAPGGGTQVQIAGQMLNLALPVPAAIGSKLQFEVQGSGAQLRLSLQAPQAGPTAATPLTTVFLPQRPASYPAPLPLPHMTTPAAPTPTLQPVPVQAPATSLSLAPVAPNAPATAVPVHPLTTLPASVQVAAPGSVTLPATVLTGGEVPASPTPSQPTPAKPMVTTTSAPPPINPPAAAPAPSAAVSPTAAVPPQQTALAAATPVAIASPTPGATAASAPGVPAARAEVPSSPAASSSVLARPATPYSPAAPSQGSAAVPPSPASAAAQTATQSAPPVPSTVAPVASAPQPATPQAALAQMVQASVPRQDTLVPLTMLLAATIGKAPLPGAVAEAGRQVLAQQMPLDTQRLTGPILARAVGQSGVFQEARLAAGTPLLPQADLKAALLTLRHTLQTWLGAMPVSVPAAAGALVPVQPPLRGATPRVRSIEVQSADPAAAPEDIGKQLLERSEAALARLRLHQNASLPDPVGRTMDWSMDLPVLVGTQPTIMQIQIHRDEQRDGEGPTERDWQMKFALNLPELGEVGAQVSLRGGAAGIMLWAVEPSTSAALEAGLQDLRNGLAAAGVRPGALVVRHGEPPPPAPSSGHLVDART